MKQAKRFNLIRYKNCFEIDIICYFVKNKKIIKELVICKFSGKVKSLRTLQEVKRLKALQEAKRLKNERN